MITIHVLINVNVMFFAQKNKFISLQNCAKNICIIKKFDTFFFEDLFSEWRKKYFSFNNIGYNSLKIVKITMGFIRG